MKNKLISLTFGLCILSSGIAAEDQHIHDHVTPETESRFINLAQRTYHQCKRTIQQLQKLPQKDEHIALIGFLGAVLLVLTKLNAGPYALNTDSFGPFISTDGTGNTITTRQVVVIPKKDLIAASMLPIMLILHA